MPEENNEQVALVLTRAALRSGLLRSGSVAPAVAEEDAARRIVALYRSIIKHLSQSENVSE